MEQKLTECRARLDAAQAQFDLLVELLGEPEEQVKLAKETRPMADPTRKTMLSDPRILKAYAALLDVIEEVLAESEVALKTAVLAVRTSKANNVLVTGCKCPKCMDEIHNTFRKLAKGRKPDATYALPEKAVH